MLRDHTSLSAPAGRTHQPPSRVTTQQKKCAEKKATAFPRVRSTVHGAATFLRPWLAGSRLRCRHPARVRRVRRRPTYPLLSLGAPGAPRATRSVQGRPRAFGSVDRVHPRARAGDGVGLWEERFSRFRWWIPPPPLLPRPRYPSPSPSPSSPKNKKSAAAGVCPAPPATEEPIASALFPTSSARQPPPPPPPLPSPLWASGHCRCSRDSRAPHAPQAGKGTFKSKPPSLRHQLRRLRRGKGSTPGHSLPTPRFLLPLRP